MTDKKIEIKLQYALRDGKIIHINDLSEEEKGLKCNCVCPACKTPLEAKKGAIRQHHFAHNNSDCNLEIAQQTALHLLAKEIIQNTKTITFPPYFIFCTDVGFKKMEGVPPFPCKESKTIVFDSIEVEKKLNDIIPDIIAKKDDHICLIEIAVTHFVDKEKTKKAKAAKLPMLEIDLSNCDRNIDRQILTQTIKNEITNKKWISNPRIFENQKKAAKEYYQKEIDRRNQKIRKLDEKEKRECELLEYKYRYQIEVRKNIEQAKQPENYTQIVKSLKNDQKSVAEYLKTTMYKQNKEMPFYLDIPVKGEIVFNCDRRIWQMILFEIFVYKRKEGVIENKKIKNYFVKRFKTDRGYEIINWNYYNKDRLDGDNFLWIAIDEYLKKLHNLGFIDYFDNTHKGILKHPYTINPPDNYYAFFLKQALREIDCFDPDASKKIDDYINQKTNL